MICLKALREAARLEVNVDTKFLLLGAAALLQEAIEAFILYQDVAQLTTLNGVWAYASRVLKLATPAVPTPTPSGRMPVPERKVA